LDKIIKELKKRSSEEEVEDEVSSFEEVKVQQKLVKEGKRRFLALDWGQRSSMRGRTVSDVGTS